MLLVCYLVTIYESGGEAVHLYTFLLLIVFDQLLAKRNIIKVNIKVIQNFKLNVT